MNAEINALMPPFVCVCKTAPNVCHELHPGIFRCPWCLTSYVSLIVVVDGEEIDLTEFDGLTLGN